MSGGILDPRMHAYRRETTGVGAERGLIRCQSRVNDLESDSEIEVCGRSEEQNVTLRGGDESSGIKRMNQVDTVAE